MWIDIVGGQEPEEPTNELPEPEVESPLPGCTLSQNGSIWTAECNIRTAHGTARLRAQADEDAIARLLSRLIVYLRANPETALATAGRRRFFRRIAQRLKPLGGRQALIQDYQW